MFMTIQGSRHECKYNKTAFSPFYQHFEKSVGSIFSTYPPDHSQKQKQNREIFSIEINIAHRSYFKQTCPC